MELPRIEKRADKGPMSEPRHEHQNQEAKNCYIKRKSVFLMRKGQPEEYQY